jgi:hypothetical protein
LKIYFIDLFYNISNIGNKNTDIDNFEFRANLPIDPIRRDGYQSVTRTCNHYIITRHANIAKTPRVSIRKINLQNWIYVPDKDRCINFERVPFVLQLVLLKILRNFPRFRMQKKRLTTAMKILL